MKSVLDYATLSETDAEELQIRMAAMVSTDHLKGPIRTIAGADTAVADESGEMFAAVVILDARTAEVIEIGRATGAVSFDYIPGLLSFREVPLVVQAFESLGEHVDLLMCDGHGLIHPRRFGLACHLGVVLDVPSIGVGKTHLLGTYSAPDHPRGSWTDVMDGGEVLGRCVRTQDGVRPVYASIGHKIDLDQATNVVIEMARRFRLPEPSRLADIEANRMRRHARGASSPGSSGNDDSLL